jgi:hypothetical protein
MEFWQTVLITVPPTIAALAAWRASKRAVHQTNGMLQDPLARIEAKLEDLLDWQVRHERTHRAERSDG